MKYLLLFCLCSTLACAPGPLNSNYSVQFPHIPAFRKDLLGEATWRLEWIGSAGEWAFAEGTATELAKNTLALPEEWTTPILAWPFWPDKGLFPGQTAPAGALFPWDVSGGEINLDWKAGVDAFFWRELAAAANSFRPGETLRLPWHFDWPAFRGLLEDVMHDDGTIAEEVRADPWLADWKEIARKTVETGFDRRHIKKRPSTQIRLPNYGRFWAGPSVFTDILEVPPDGQPELPAYETAQTWISEAGFLRCQAGIWIFTPWPD